MPINRIHDANYWAHTERELNELYVIQFSFKQSIKRFVALRA